MSQNFDVGRQFKQTFFIVRNLTKAARPRVSSEGLRVAIGENRMRSKGLAGKSVLYLRQKLPRVLLGYFGLRALLYKFGLEPHLVLTATEGMRGGCIIQYEARRASIKQPRL